MSPPVNGHKSWEGSISMFLISLLSGTALLFLYFRLPFDHIAAAVFPAAIAGSITELYSPSEWDTVTTPVAILIVLLLLL